MARHLSRIISVALAPLGLFAFAVVSWADISAFDIKKPTGEIRHGEEVQIEWLHSQLLTNKIIIEVRGTKGTKGKHSVDSEECLKNKGSCTWVVPADIDPGHYRITITSTKNKQNYIKGPVFTIVGDAQGPVVESSTPVEHKRSCTGGAGRVLVPKLAANWAQGSTVMLEWRPNDDNELVDLYLDCDAFAIAKGVPDKGYHLWKIPNDVPTGKNKKISVLPVEDDAAGVTSKKFALQAWTETERYRGRDQRYDSDLSDRPQVTSPVEGSRYPRGEPPILRWDDPDHLLLDQIRIELYQHHTAKEILRWNHKNTGVFELPDDSKKRIKRFCRQKPGCYFVVYSRRHTERRIASGHFLLGKDKKASPESFAVRLLPAGTDPEGVAESLSEVTMGDKVQIRWNDLAAANRPVRVELRKDGLHYLTIADAIESTADGDNVRDWVIPYGALPDEGYSISITLADDATVTAESPVFLLQGEADNRMSLNEIPDSAWELKTGRTIVPIQWKKPARVSALRVDLYRAGRRVKTISDSATKRRTNWSVPRPLPSGADYQIRIQELIEGDTGDQSHFAFSDPFCIYRSDDAEPRDAVCGPAQSGHTTIALTYAEHQWCADQNIDDLKCRPALESACSTADIPPAECTPAELVTHEHCAIAGIDGPCNAEALEALRADCQRLGIGLVPLSDYNGDAAALLAAGYLVPDGQAQITTVILTNKIPADPVVYKKGMTKTLAGKRTKDIKVDLSHTVASEPSADGRHKITLTYKVKNKTDREIENVWLEHKLNKVFKKGGYDILGVPTVVDASCTQAAVRAEPPEEVLESPEPVEPATPASAETICTGAPFDKGRTVLAITAVQPDNEPVQRYFSDHLTSGDRQIIEQIASDKPWGPLRLERAFQIFEGRHKLSETLVPGSLLLLKIPSPAKGEVDNAVVFARFADDPDADLDSEVQEPGSVVVDYTKGSARVAWPQGRVRWLARYATPSPEDTGALIALERIDPDPDPQDIDRKLYRLEPGILRGTLTAVALVALDDDLSLVEYIDHGKGELLNSQEEVAASVNYETGEIILIKAPNQKTPLYVSYVKEVVDEEVLGLNGSAATAKNPAVLPANKSLIPGSLRIHIGQLTLADAHYSPELKKMRTSGKRRGASQGEVDYVTGRLDLSFGSPLANGQSINADYLVRIPMASGQINYETGVLNLSGVDKLQTPLTCSDLISVALTTSGVDAEQAPATLQDVITNPDATPQDFADLGIPGVTAENLAEVLEAIRNADPTPTTAAQIQDIVDGVIRLAGVTLNVITYLRNETNSGRNPEAAAIDYDDRQYYSTGVSGAAGDIVEYLVVVSNATTAGTAPGVVVHETPPVFTVYIAGSAEVDATGSETFSALTDQRGGELTDGVVMLEGGTIRAYVGEDRTIAAAPSRSALRYRARVILSVLAEVLEDSSSDGGADNTNDTAVTTAQLESIDGISHVNSANEAAYQDAIRQKADFSDPPTVEQVQSLINAVNSDRAIEEVFEDSTGGAANDNGIPVSAAQLGAITGITGVNPAREAAYQQAILEKMDFGNPPSLEQIQELINTVNAEDN